MLMFLVVFTLSGVLPAWFFTYWLRSTRAYHELEADYESLFDGLVSAERECDELFAELTYRQAHPSTSQPRGKDGRFIAQLGDSLNDRNY